MVLLVRIRREPKRIKPKLTAVFGYITRKPPVWPIRVLLARIKRPVILSTQFTRVVRTFGAVVAAVFPKRVRVLLTRRPPRRPTQAKFIRPIVRFVVFPQGPLTLLVPGRKPTRGTVRLGRPVGRHATKNPPIYPIRVVSFATRERWTRRYRVSRSTRTMVVRTFAPIPPTGARVVVQRLSIS